MYIDSYKKTIEEFCHKSTVCLCLYIIVMCTFPLDLLGPFVVKAHETVHLINKKDLMKLTIGHCTIWNVHRRDKVHNID